MSPDNPASEVGSEYDDVDYGIGIGIDDHESEGGGEDAFAGVTSDLEVRSRQKRYFFFLRSPPCGGRDDSVPCPYGGMNPCLPRPTGPHRRCQALDPSNHATTDQPDNTKTAQSNQSWSKRTQTKTIYAVRVR